MKRSVYLMITAFLVIAGCQPKTKIVPVDTAAVKDSVTSFLDEYTNGFNAGDSAAMEAILADDGLFCGTDPAELWDKETFVHYLGEALADTALKVNYAAEKREIRIAADGNSALVLDQFIMDAISQKIPVRVVYHLIKTDDGWKIDFFSWAFIPKNEEIAILNKALEEGK